MLEIITLFAIWSIIWKGVALWMSAKNDHKGWFIIFMIINIFTIPEIIYVMIHKSKQKEKRDFE